jgi:hypothetical protein
MPLILPGWSIFAAPSAQALEFFPDSSIAEFTKNRGKRIHFQIQGVKSCLMPVVVAIVKSHNDKCGRDAFYDKVKYVGSTNLFLSIL